MRFRKRTDAMIIEAAPNYELLTPKEISQKYERWIDDGEKWVPFEEYYGDATILVNGEEMPVKEYVESTDFKIPVMKRSD